MKKVLVTKKSEIIYKPKIVVFFKCQTDMQKEIKKIGKKNV